MSSSLIFLGVLAALVLYGVAIYNRMVDLRNRFKNAFAQIDVQLRRRYDLIPNLVETAKKYMAHERETLEAVVNARNAAMAASQRLGGNATDAAAVQELLKADTGLTGALGRLFALSESYPDLKASQNMQQLSEELTSTENKVAFSRQAYNDAVMTYNTAIEQFPNVLLAGPFGFKAATLWELDDEAARAPVKVSF